MNIYLPNSVLHILFALSHIRYNGADDNLVLVLNEYVRAPQVANLLNQDFDMATFVLLPGSFNHDAWAVKQRRGDSLPVMKLAARALAMLTQFRAKQHTQALLAKRSVHPQNLYVFDDTRLDAQSIMSLVLRYNPQAKIHYIEDGVGAYHDISVSHPLKQHVSQWLPLLYGAQSQFVPAHGAHPAVQAGIVLKPAYVNTPLQQKSITAMPPFSLTDADVALLTRAFDVSVDALRASSSPAVILQPLRSNTPYTHLNQREMLHQLIRHYTQDGYTIFIKYHPREGEEDYLAFGSLPNVRILDRSVPVELFCLALGQRLQALYAPFSTSLLTTGWLMPHLNRYLIDPFDEHVPFREKLKRMMIEDNVQLYTSKASPS